MPTPTKYSYKRLDHVFGMMSSGYPRLEDYYNDKYLKKATRDRLADVTINAFGKIVAQDLAAGNTEYFTSFFDLVDDLYQQGDKNLQNLIVTGLFESLQKRHKGENTYHHAYDEWLPKTLLKVWQTNIDFWEGTDWRDAGE